MRAKGTTRGQAMSRRLLLVDDDEAIREIARLSLERVGGWEVVAVADGRGAIDAVDGACPFDAVILDVMMPGLDGPTTLARLRAGPLPADVPAVFLTAKVQPADRERLYALGGAGVIAKPFDPMAMPAELDRILGAGG
jgi:CheY-like chemotaxis protein